MPSSKMTTSPKILTSTPPFSISTNRVKISRMALLRALTSIAQTPRTTVGLLAPAAGMGAKGEGGRLSVSRILDVEGLLGGGIDMMQKGGAMHRCK